MTKSDNGTFEQKHPPASIPDPEISKEIYENTQNDELPCAVAFQINKITGKTPLEIGKTADLLNIRIVKCQLGLFGYPEKKVVKPKTVENENMKKQIEDSLKNGKLGCADAWTIADNFDVARMHVSAYCETMEIKIDRCQLGAF